MGDDGGYSSWDSDTGDIGGKWRGNWNQCSNFEAVGWSFGQFGRLTPALIWQICKSNDPDLEHPDILGLLYVCRLSSYCDGVRFQDDAQFWLQMHDWEAVIDADMKITN